MKKISSLHLEHFVNVGEAYNISDTSALEATLQGFTSSPSAPGQDRSSQNHPSKEPFNSDRSQTLSESSKNIPSSRNLLSQISDAESSSVASSDAASCKPFNDLNLNTVDEEDEFLYGDSNSLPEIPKSVNADPVENKKVILCTGWSDDEDNDNSTAKDKRTAAHLVWDARNQGEIAKPNVSLLHDKLSRIKRHKKALLKTAEDLFHPPVVNEEPLEAPPIKSEEPDQEISPGVSIKIETENKSECHSAPKVLEKTRLVKAKTSVSGKIKKKSKCHSAPKILKILEKTIVVETKNNPSEKIKKQSKCHSAPKILEKTKLVKTKSSPSEEISGTAKSHRKVLKTNRWITSRKGKTLVGNKPDIKTDKLPVNKQKHLPKAFAQIDIENIKGSSGRRTVKSSSSKKINDTTKSHRKVSITSKKSKILIGNKLDFETDKLPVKQCKRLPKAFALKDVESIENVTGSSGKSIHPGKESEQESKYLRCEPTRKVSLPRPHAPHEINRDDYRWFAPHIRPPDVQGLPSPYIRPPNVQRLPSSHIRPPNVQRLPSPHLSRNPNLEHERKVLESRHHSLEKHGQYSHSSDKQRGSHDINSKSHRSKSPQSHLSQERSRSPRGHRSHDRSSSPRLHSSHERSKSPRLHTPQERSRSPRRHRSRERSRSPRLHRSHERSKSPQSHRSQERFRSPRRPRSHDRSRSPRLHRSHERSRSPRRYRCHDRSRSPRLRKSRERSRSPRRHKSSSSPRLHRSYERSKSPQSRWPQERARSPRRRRSHDTSRSPRIHRSRERSKTPRSHQSQERLRSPRRHRSPDRSRSPRLHRSHERPKSPRRSKSQERNAVVKDKRYDKKKKSRDDSRSSSRSSFCSVSFDSLSNSPKSPVRHKSQEKNTVKDKSYDKRKQSLPASEKGLDKKKEIRYDDRRSSGSSFCSLSLDSVSSSSSDSCFDSFDRRESADVPKHDMKDKITEGSTKSLDGVDVKNAATAIPPPEDFSKKISDFLSSSRDTASDSSTPDAEKIQMLVGLIENAKKNQHSKEIVQEFTQNQASCSAVQDDAVFPVAVPGDASDPQLPVVPSSESQARPQPSQVDYSPMPRSQSLDFVDDNLRSVRTNVPTIRNPTLRQTKVSNNLSSKHGDSNDKLETRKSASVASTKKLPPETSGRKFEKLQICHTARVSKGCDGY